MTARVVLTIMVCLTFASLRAEDAKPEVAPAVAKELFEKLRDPKQAEAAFFKISDMLRRPRMKFWMPEPRPVKIVTSAVVKQTTGQEVAIVKLQ